MPLRPHPTRLRSSVPRSPACGRGHGLAWEADAPWCLEDPGDAGPGPVAVSAPLPGDGATPGTRPRCTVPMGSSARARPTGGPAALGPWCCSLGRRGGGTQEPERAGRRLREVARPTVSCAGPRGWPSLCGQATPRCPQLLPAPVGEQSFPTTLTSYDVVDAIFKLLNIINMTYRLSDRVGHVATPAKPSFPTRLLCHLDAPSGRRRRFLWGAHASL